ncbi:calcium homeostasis endoplasmic reticulum protein [Neodiprion virginianus]|uniref:calcium homeostasis endoplasmic reticulum protein n=1 Tax=Neodiprion fabricii TaxID=2872261 RepID=UPI001ED92568|nr:calcium homeostasis endoplasmic reticulum protein [Neodiprion fabricii]XP_046614614.1 calcium homeostasis endoplasmic reticulum protein [Neodiprion virginianus]
MDQAPADTDLRNIIDKLAQFVARNGPEFEQMTKNKQKDNPKFGFLFGGEHFNYYQYKVTTEQAILKQKGINPMQNADPRLNVSQQQQTAAAVASPQNNVSLASSLSAQNNGLSQVVGNPGPVIPGITGVPGVSGVPGPIGGPGNVGPPVGAIPGPIRNVNSPIGGVNPGVNIAGPSGWLRNELAQLQSQQATLREQVRQSEQNLAAQHAALMAQQQGRVEEAVRQAQEASLQNNAQHTNTDLSAFDSVLQPIIESCTKDSISAGKAWILQNSITAQSNQVIAEHLLKKVIQGAAFSQKLHVIYLVNDVLHHCARKKSIDLRKAMESVVVPMFCNTSLAATDEQLNKLNKLLSLWESKNNYFDDGIIEKLKQPSISWSEYQASLVSKHASAITPITTSTKQTFENYQAQHQAFINHAMRQIQTIEQQKISIDQQLKAPPPPPPQMNQTNLNIPPTHTGPPPPMSGGDMNFSQPPPGWGVPGAPEPPPFTNVPLPDFSKPPPGFGPPPIIHEPSMEDLMPSMPYFELPAGLMVPLIKLEDGEYKSLDPDAIRLPPPAPPSDRLVAAVEAFYAPPNHDSPRDSDGWEKLGLYEYYKAKNAARKRKEEDILSGLRQRSRSPSPILRPRSKSPSPPKKRYRSKSRSRSRSRSKGRSRSRSPTSNHRRNSRNSSNHNSRSRRNRRNSNKERSPDSKRGDRSDRSPTPPSFLGSTYSKAQQEISLDESNKGHQLLKKMGWGGAGLGANEQGIEAPISGGEIRDKNDQYKGVGINLNDPYENFRKSKGQAFITRMKARAEERAEERAERD